MNETTRDHPAPTVEVVTGAWLDAQEFPPLRWVVPNIIAEGLTILAGAPKLGKSWLVLHLALTVSSGGKAFGCINVGRPRPVLYLALEDGHRRLQFRARQLLNEGERIPDRLHIVIKGGRLELETTLVDWLDQHQRNQPLVIVDTLAKLRPATNKSDNAYDADYRFVGRLKDIIDTVSGGAMVLVHHTNKRADGDFLDAVSGTQGIAGAADATVTLRRARQEHTATLSVTGRDVIEAEYSITTVDGLWTLDGGGLEAAAKAAGENRQTANLGENSADLVRFVNGRTVTTPADLAQHLGIELKLAGTRLSQSVDAGRIRRIGRGQYAPCESRESRESAGSDVDSDSHPTVNGVNPEDAASTNSRLSRDSQSHGDACRVCGQAFLLQEPGKTVCARRDDAHDTARSAA